MFLGFGKQDQLIVAALFSHTEVILVDLRSTFPSKDPFELSVKMFDSQGRYLVIPELLIEEGRLKSPQGIEKLRSLEAEGMVAIILPQNAEHLGQLAALL